MPAADRRGLFGRLTIIAERQDPFTYTPAMKAVILCVVSLAAIVGPFGGAVFLPALDHVVEDLDTTKDIVNISYGVYTLSLGIFPLWWSGISETSGRRSVYLVSFTLFTAFSIGCALSPNMGALMAFRILSGGAGAAVQSVGAGTLSDVYEAHQRGRAMGYFYLGPLMGPMLAPVIGGAVTIEWGWRGTMWFLVILGGIITVLIFFFLPETLPRKQPETAPDPDDPTQHADVLVPVPSRSSYVTNEETAAAEADVEGGFSTTRFSMGRFKQAIHKRPGWHHGPKKDAVDDTVLYRTFVKPLRSFRLLMYPPVPLAIVFATYTFMALYILNVSLQTLYAGSPYNFSALIQGLVYLPNSVGYLFASIGNGYWSDWIIARCIREHGVVIPEKRLGKQVYLGSALVPISFVIFGWCADYRLHWVTPLVGTFLFGIGAMLVFGNVATYLVDALPGRGSSGVALNNFFRMTFAGIGTFVAAPWINGMGYGWMFTMLAIGSVLCFASIIAIKVRGNVWRESFDIDKLA